MTLPSLCFQPVNRLSTIAGTTAGESDELFDSLSALLDNIPGMVSSQSAELNNPSVLVRSHLPGETMPAWITKEATVADCNSHLPASSMGTNACGGAVSITRMESTDFDDVGANRELKAFVESLRDNKGKLSCALSLYV